jgi:hypothetical protein
MIATPTGIARARPTVTPSMTYTMAAAHAAMANETRYTPPMGANPANGKTYAGRTPV